MVIIFLQQLFLKYSMFRKYILLIIAFSNCDYIFSQIEKPIQLEEIVILKSKINAIDLGIISKTTKMKFTKAERRLQEAKSGILAPIINSFNGKIEMRKKEIIVERNEIALEKLANIFEDEFYLKTLKIPSDYIKSFQYYVIENTDFCLALKANNKDMMKLIMINVSIDFNNFNINQSTLKMQKKQ